MKKNNFEMKNKVSLALLSLFIIGAIISSVFLFGAVQETVLGLTKDNIYFGDANPNIEKLELTDVQPREYETATIKVFSPISSYLQYSDESLCTFGTFYKMNDRTYIVDSQASRGRCCSVSGYRDVSIPQGRCFKEVSVNPSLVTLKIGGVEYWRYDRSNTVFPQEVDISEGLNSQCATSIAESKRQGGSCTEFPCNCIVPIVFESSENVGQMAVSLGNFVLKPVPECAEGDAKTIECEDSTSADYGRTAITERCTDEKWVTQMMIPEWCMKDTIPIDDPDPDPDPECVSDSDCSYQDTCNPDVCIGGECVALGYEPPKPTSCSNHEWKEYPLCRWECIELPCGEGFETGDMTCRVGETAVGKCTVEGWELTESCEFGCENKYSESEKGNVKLSTQKVAVCKEPEKFNYWWIVLIVSVIGAIMMALYQIGIRRK